TTGDFSTIYAATRCWLHGENPYDRAALKAELAKAGAPPDIQHEQDINPSVYLPSAMPWMALIGNLLWRPANIAWCLLSLLLFAISLGAILGRTRLSTHGKWLAASAALAFSPTYVGIYDGNPGVIVISLVSLAICFGARQSTIASGILVGIALCFKPQIAICPLCVLVAWKNWKAAAAGVAIFAASLALGALVISGFGHNWNWWNAEQHNLAISFQPGGQSDPAPNSPVAWQMLNTQALMSYAIHNRKVCDLAVWILVAGLTALFWRTRKICLVESYWRDVAFFSTATLMITYHRYYDAQLLLLLIPLLASVRGRQQISFSVIYGCLLLLAFPLQSILARWLGSQATVESFTQFLLLRNQPAAVLLIACTVALYCAIKTAPDKGI
ncbi:MAG: DUF2029 domain-containing protein, partial [Acidobacteriaceae bacterium]|nr:DUF2029 domain-containing protein [Acidobacteriaceae bacterium]